MKLTKVVSSFRDYHCREAKCAKPTLSKRYVKILATCVGFASVKEIYSGKRNIIPDQLYALEAGGFLERFTTPEWARKYNADHCYKFPKTWWRTTPKGVKVIAEAILAH